MEYILNYAVIFTFRISQVKRKWLELFLGNSKIRADIAKRYLGNISSFSQVATCIFSKTHQRFFSSFSVLSNYRFQVSNFFKKYLWQSVFFEKLQFPIPKNSKENCGGLHFLKSCRKQLEKMYSTTDAASQFSKNGRTEKYE